MTNSVSERAPDAPGPWIAGTGVLAVAADPGRPFVRLPDPSTKVIVRSEARGRTALLVSGPRVRATYHEGKRDVSCVEVRLAPGTTRPLLGVPAIDLVGRIVPLEALPSPAARRLARELACLEPEEVAARLTEVLPDRLPTAAEGARAELLRAAVAALSVRSGRAPGHVRDVARELAVSERQLRNLFSEGVGLSPKHYARIDRVRAVLSRATGLAPAELAAETGYYDQSHMTSDFRTLMGVPPRSYFSGRLPAPGACQVIDSL
ncbi:AraC-like DNA-binding protein [Streptomyces sp. SAI-117]|uniref:AraC family transcriptional regulator n=1 Tax=Streptomyces sp. SAI-117 TaxID=2940546 RepID=UPI0024749CD8|nr:helix-turn-helix domain-containing protein [Streptomyces sp. SAI-117]MDH6566887.1 AraC-like DNA-binding protein [Streptomyces sp. SAI-117]